ncbi:hypothetical protein SAMN05216420_11632 [Nitrosospira sp. Nl5]|uniref:hypothetical protein n=1 Tax=Nitrosospira sp. Nl5 TaxID=200120 RepID=UPI0008900DD1|nr:hypothetical protein [Nitrosospira sp. Nl5]SCY74799.1 hypothetical protein SAMN05216420_11632 [Nitrosospira sp. Nl5]
MTTLDSSQQSELEKPVTRTVYFVELDFRDSTARICSANITLTWGGYEWIGLGSMGAISAVEEAEGVESKSLTFNLNVAQHSVLALAVGDVEQYRGRNAKMYFCPLDESFQPVGTPVICWRGIMDTMAVAVDGEEGGITLKAETSAYGLKKQPGLRLNAAQQKSRYPTDTGFDYLTDLIANPQIWLSKKFQRSIN